MPLRTCVKKYFLLIDKSQYKESNSFYKYQLVFSACGGTLSGSSGSFVSPGYPGFYSNNLNCLWTLFIPANGVLRLPFIVFETQLW